MVLCKGFFTRQQLGWVGWDIPFPGHEDPLSLSSSFGWAHFTLQHLHEDGASSQPGEQGERRSGLHLSLSTLLGQDLNLMFRGFTPPAAKPLWDAAV